MEFRACNIDYQAYLSGIDVGAVLIDVGVIRPQRRVRNTRCGSNTLAGIPRLNNDNVGAVLTLSSQPDNLCIGKKGKKPELKKE